VIGGFSTAYPTILPGLPAALASDPDGARLVILTYFNPFSGTGSPYEAAVDQALLGSDRRIDCTGAGTAIGLNDLIVCQEKLYAPKAIVVDVYPAFVGKGPSLTHINQGDIHPTNAGYAAIATSVRTAL
jgi:hypothetical protein